MSVILKHKNFLCLNFTKESLIYLDKRDLIKVKESEGFLFNVEKYNYDKNNKLKSISDLDFKLSLKDLSKEVLFQLKK